MNHQVGVDPVDNSRIEISDLEQGGHLRVPGTMTRLLVPTEISYW